MESPRWLLKDVGAGTPKTFFVALKSEGDKASQPVEVEMFDPGKMGYVDARYQLPDGRLIYRWESGESTARIDVTTKEPGSQIVQVFVTGDTPWTSLSEYRVANGKLQPLRHGQSSEWLLLGIPICLFVFAKLWRPINRGIDRMMGAEPG